MTVPSEPISRRARAAAGAGAVGPWLAMASLAAWSASPSHAALAVAAAGVAASAAWGLGRNRASALALVLLVVGTAAGFLGHRNVDGVAGDWEGYWERQEERVGAWLDGALEDRLSAAEGTAAALAALAADSVPRDMAVLARLRGEAQVAALALYGPEGELLAWDGVHRGLVPEDVQRGLRRYAYSDLALFGYLYVTAPTPSGGTAMAAVLLRADLPRHLASEAGDFASDFRRRWGESIRLTHAGTAEDEPGWDWRLGDRTLFTVVLEPPVPEARVGAILDGWRQRIAVTVSFAWLLLTLGARPGRPRLAGAAAGAMLLALLLPFDTVGPLAPLFEGGGSSFFLAPGLSLGRLAVLTLAGVVLAAYLPPDAARLRAYWAGATAPLLYPLALLWLGRGVPHALLAESHAAWIVFQGTAVILLTLLTGALLSLVRTTSRRTPALAWAAAALAVILGGWAAVRVVWGGGVPVWWPALWALPVALAVRGGARRGTRAGHVATWALAGVMAATAAVPVAWGVRVEARREVAAAYLNRLALPEEPEVEEALIRLGEVAPALARAGEGGVGLLYRAWRASGMAELGSPTWMTLWSPGGVPGEELRIGVAQRPVAAFEIQEDPLPVGVPRVVRHNRDDARYVLRVALPGDAILTAVAPPFADPASLAVLSPLFARGDLASVHPLTLVPRATWEGTWDGVRWSRHRGGWRAEASLSYANALYRAQYAVTLPGPLLALARATLLLVINMAVFFLAWGAGRTLLGGHIPSPMRGSLSHLSFRARVTVALFGFFALAVALFGTVAYRTLEGTAGRAAQVLAGRVAEDAAGWYAEVGGRMQALSPRVGAELLEYRGAELREGSVEELVALGLYEGWLPHAVHTRLSQGDDVRDFAEAQLGNWPYVSAFRRLPDGGVIAAQIPRTAGATAIRSSDVLELLAFSVVLGAVLSLGLALLVGRALTRPIQALQVASERVGAGNLELALPEERSDEFGAVFRAFNRMVARVRRARRQLVRTTRRTRAIMEEAAVGMVALDRQGRVTLANPRAEGVLAQRIVPGEPLPHRGRLGRELVDWLRDFLDGVRDEADVELHDQGRRIRVRARRLEKAPARGGAVVALEDVTDELRTERVLAWGEMARQVAHEVKNPLTPMKLSVQHIRRAWDDQRTDFDAILVRNVDAILGEIDRLAAIAKSFSRFGAPGDAAEEPLEPVVVQAVVGEVLALYRGSEGPVSFEDATSSHLPPARARAREMKEVLVNLLENARIATPLGGVVRVEGSEEAGGGVLVQVVDSGAGIPEGVKARVFEPQFSTRSTGAGLGLAIVRRLVESWGGTVELESREGAGTRVLLHLLPWDRADLRQG